MKTGPLGWLVRREAMRQVGTPGFGPEATLTLRAWLAIAPAGGDASEARSAARAAS